MGCGSSRNPSIREDATKFTASKFVVQNSQSIKDIYEIQEVLGEGAFAEVRRCVHKASGDHRALKVLKKTADSEQEIKTMINEINVVKSLDHPNILKMYEFFEDENHFFLVFELCEGGELFDEIYARGNFTERETALLIRQVLSCISYCHKKNIVHRDLKPENLLLEANKEFDQIKIIDFGCSASHKEQNSGLRETVGTPYYMAPEILRHRYGKKVDVWACGVIAYVLLCGEAPFVGEHDGEIFKNIKSNNYAFRQPIWNEISPAAKNFVRTLLNPDPSARPTAEKALKHSWVQQATKALEKKVSPKLAQEAMDNLSKFHTGALLQKATNAYIASQLLTKSERVTIDEIFRALDVDGVGVLSRERFIQGYKSYFNAAVPDNEMEEIFKSVDADGSGMIDYSEFLVAAMDSTKVASRERLYAAFQMFDKDGGGTISKAEIRQILSFGKKGGISNALVEKIVAEVDENGDDEITFEEFEKIMASKMEDKQIEPIDKQEVAVEAETADNAVSAPASL